MNNTVIRNTLDQCLSNNEKSLIDNILSFVTCELCLELDHDCRCQNCVLCDTKIIEEYTFICLGRCKGDIMCYDCENEFECQGCGDKVCGDCLTLDCECGTWCCYCEDVAVCYEDDSLRTWH